MHLLVPLLFSREEKLQKQNKGMRETIKELKSESRIAQTELKKARKKFRSFRKRHPKDEMTEDPSNRNNDNNNYYYYYYCYK